MNEMKDFDVVVVGGGLAGLTLALQLLRTRPRTKVAVIERAGFPVPEAAHKVGEATVENGAYYFREVLGLEDHLEAEQFRKLGLRFFMTAGDNRAIAPRFELGSRRFLASRTYQLDRGRFENELARRAASAGAHICDESMASEVVLDPDGVHRVLYTREGEERELRSRWVVDASGRRAVLKGMLGLRKPVAHDVNAVWFRLAEMIDVGDFIDADEPLGEPPVRDAWRERVPSGERWRSTNHFMGSGYWTWLIPLASGSISVGIVADEAIVPFKTINRFEKALDWLRLNEPQIADAVEARAEGLQDFRSLRHYAHGCAQVYSADRWCITGEAGTFLDPLYSPGSDFIGLSNTYITDLLVRDLEGEDVAERAGRYNAAYLAAFESALTTWQDQYPLMGNPQVWGAKTAWDTVAYFATLNLLFVNDALCDLGFMDSVAPTWCRYEELAQGMQKFFRAWAERDDGEVADGAFGDLSDEIYDRLNAELLTRLERPELRVRLDRNVALLEDAALEIVDGAAQRIGEEAAAEIAPAALADRLTTGPAPPSGAMAGVFVARPVGVDAPG
jgi:flavin-dependent dehydrogenase